MCKYTDMCKGGSAGLIPLAVESVISFRRKWELQKKQKQKHHLRWPEGEGWCPARRQIASKGAPDLAFSGRRLRCVWAAAARTGKQGRREGNGVECGSGIWRSRG